MTIKKGIISISTIVVVILGVFLAVRVSGGRGNADNVKLPDDSIVQSEKSIPKDNNGAITNENEKSNLSSNETQNGVENIQGESTNKMDAAYINDKTNVGIYTVKENDTVFSIVKTYMPSHDKNKIVKFIKNRNSIDGSYKIAKGQKIVIPYQKTIETSKAVGSKAVEPKANTIEYTVKKQDTLTSIAKNNMSSYNVKHAIEMLKETNKITNENTIKEGILIYIPK